MKTHIFPTPLRSTPNLKMLSLHCIPQILYAKSLDTWLINCVKSFPLRLSHNISVTYEPTEDRQTHRAIDAYSIAEVHQ